MVELLIVRHAKTAWNLSGKIQGMSDVPLVPQSEVEALEVGKTLSARHIDAVFSSPLVRAVRTAELLTEGRGMEIKKDTRLSERDFGEFEGRTYEELALEDHTRLFFSLNDSVEAESSESVFKRTKSFVDELMDKYDGKTVLIVSHGVCISYLVYALTHDRWNENDYDMSYIENLTLSVYKAGRN